MLLVLTVACGGGAALSGGTPTPSNARASAPINVAFTDVLVTAMARHDGGPTVLVASTATSLAAVTRLVPVSAPAQDRILIAAFQGEQRTGGYAIAITKIERDGDRVVVHATLVTPAPDAMTTQVITSPAHVVSVRAVDVAGARIAILLDASGTQQAQVDIV